MQAAGQIIDANQYYFTAAPQPMATQAGVSYQYTGGYYAEPYMVTPTPPPHGAQQVIMPVGHPGFIYMPQPSNPVYYSVPAAAPGTAATPYFYASDVFVQQPMHFQQQMVQQQSVLPPEAANNRTKSAVRPLSTSTPLPTEFISIPPPMTNQLPSTGNLNVAHLKYHRNMEQDDVLANLSKISIVSEETVGAENEQEFEQRPPREQRPPPVPFNYKTRMCLTYASGKQCEMGSRCKFAHGPEELRVADAPTRAPNARYKTKLCKNFGPYSSNYCPYGLRCEFIHPNDKEYALVAHTAQQPGRNSNFVENISQNMCNITPETLCEAPPVSVTRSAAKPAVEKILLKNRNIAGSMMCLASSGRRDHISDDSAIGSGSSECGGSLAQVRTLAKARAGFQAPTVPMKFLRRRSMSQLTLKRFNSSENLDVAASCSQLANLDHNRNPMSILSPLK